MWSEHFLDFLAEHFEEGLQCRTINLIRLAVSITHDSIEGVHVGQHPLVSRLMKGVYNSCPPQPKYSRTWDVEIVLRYLRSNDRANLSQKLTLLFALVEQVEAQNCRHQLDRMFRAYRPKGVMFQLPTLTKRGKLVPLQRSGSSLHSPVIRSCVRWLVKGSMRRRQAIS